MNSLVGYVDSNENQDFVPLKNEEAITDDDTVVIHCTYNSTGITTNTTGGDESADEMCFVFLLYWSETITGYIDLVYNGVRMSTQKILLG